MEENKTRELETAFSGTTTQTFEGGNLKKSVIKYYYAGSENDIKLGGETYYAMKRDFNLIKQDDDNNTYPEKAPFLSGEFEDIDKGVKFENPTCFYINKKLLVQMNEKDIELKNVSFLPDPKNSTFVPILIGDRYNDLDIEDCEFVGDVKIILGENSKIRMKDVKAKGSVEISSHMTGEIEIIRTKIDGKDIIVRDSFVNDYVIDGENVLVDSQLLSGREDKSFISGKNIKLTSNDFNEINATDFFGDNIEIKNSTISNGVILTGSKIEDSKLLGTQKYPQIVESGSRIVESELVGAVVVKNADVLCSNLEFSQNENQPSLVVGSVVNQCFGKMPKVLKKSIAEDCRDISFKNVNNCELKDIQKVQLEQKNELEDLDVENKYISKDIQENREKDMQTTVQTQLPKSELKNIKDIKQSKKSVIDKKETNKEIKSTAIRESEIVL